MDKTSAQQRIIDEKDRIIEEQSKIIEQRSEEADRYKRMSHGDYRGTLKQEEIENIRLKESANAKLKSGNVWCILIDIIWALELIAVIIRQGDLGGVWEGLAMISTLIVVLVNIIKIARSLTIVHKLNLTGHIIEAKSVKTDILLTFILTSSTFLAFFTLMWLEIQSGV